MIYIDFHQTVYEIVSTYPQYKSVLIEAGFTKLTDLSVLNTMGKIMTLEKGMMIREISIMDLERVSNRFHFTLLKEKSETNSINNKKENL